MTSYIEMPARPDFAQFRADFADAVFTGNGDALAAYRAWSQAWQAWTAERIDAGNEASRAHQARAAEYGRLASEAALLNDYVRNNMVGDDRAVSTATYAERVAQWRAELGVYAGTDCSGVQPVRLAVPFVDHRPQMPYLDEANAPRDYSTEVSAALNTAANSGR